MHAIVSARVTAPSAMNPELPRAFDEIVLVAMHRDPSRRFASVRELGASLMPWASDVVRERWATEFGVDPSALRMPPRRAGGRRAAMVVVVASLLGVGVLGVRAWGRAGAAGPPRELPAPIAEPLAPETVESTPVPADVDPPKAGRRPEGPPSASAPSASPTPPVPPARPHPSRPPIRASTTASVAAPQRGTNGALILE
jgi:hypothetical protein